MEIILQKLDGIQNKIVVLENDNKMFQQQLDIIKEKITKFIEILKKGKKPKRENTEIEEHMKQINSTLSALESYAKQYGCNSNTFNAYDNFNCGTVKRKEQLRDQIIAQLDVLNASHTIYRKQYGGYQFPHNMTQQQMVQVINQWKGYVPQQDKVYYDTAIKILQGQPVQSFSNQLGNDARVNPAFLAGSTGVVYESRQIGQKAVDDYNKRGINPQMKLNYQTHGDSNINRAGQRELHRQQQNTVLDRKFDYVVNAVIGMVTSNSHARLEQYKRDVKDFIMEYEKHVNQYQIYWYHNSKTEHEKKLNELWNLCDQVGSKERNIFNDLWNCLNNGFC